jgi:hypothetical protein
MIYSRFGTKLTPISKEQDASGRITIQVEVDGVTDLRHYPIADLKADDGMPEINDTVAKLPWQSVTRSAPRPDEK